MNFKCIFIFLVTFASISSFATTKNLAKCGNTTPSAGNPIQSFSIDFEYDEASVSVGVLSGQLEGAWRLPDDRVANNIKIAIKLKGLSRAVDFSTDKILAYRYGVMPTTNQEAAEHLFLYPSGVTVFQRIEMNPEAGKITIHLIDPITRFETQFVISNCNFNEPSMNLFNKAHREKSFLVRTCVSKLNEYLEVAVITNETNLPIRIMGVFGESSYETYFGGDIADFESVGDRATFGNYFADILLKNGLTLTPGAAEVRKLLAVHFGIGVRFSRNLINVEGTSFEKVPVDFSSCAFQNVDKW